MDCTRGREVHCAKKGHHIPGLHECPASKRQSSNHKPKRQEGTRDVPHAPPHAPLLACWSLTRPVLLTRWSCSPMQVSPDAVIQVVRACTTLKSLCLAGHLGVDDLVMELVAKNLACLTKLIVLGVEQWTDQLVSRDSGGSQYGGRISEGENFARNTSPLRKVAKFPPRRNFRGVTNNFIANAGAGEPCQCRHVQRCTWRREGTKMCFSDPVV